MDDFTPRRPKQVIDDAAVLCKMLDEAPVGFLGMSRDGESYVLPVAFARQGDTIFLHSAREGKKVAFLRANTRVCLTAAPRAEYVPGKATFRYQSVIAYGEAEFVEDADAKRQAYAALNAKYEPEKTEPVGDTCLARSAIIAIRVRKMTGKRGALDL